MRTRTPSNSRRTRDSRTPDPRTAVWLVCLGTGFVTLIDQSMVGVVVPALRADLNATATQVQWILASYSLAFGLVLVPAGRLGDVLGRRVLHLGGFAVFAAAAVLSATADDAWTVVLARALQGVGAGIVNPQVHGTLQAVFRGPERARAFAGYSVATACSSACGPLLGGLLTGVGGPELGWRLVLAANIPLTVLLLPIAVRHLPRTPRTPLPRGGLDLPGSVLVAGLTVALLLPFATGRISVGVFAPCLLAVVVLVVALLTWERRLHRRGDSPLLVPALFQRWDFSLGTGVAMCVFGSVLALGMLQVLVLQSGLGLSAFDAGLVLLPAAVVSGVSAALCARLVVRWGRRVVVVATLAATAAVTAEALLLPAFPEHAVPVAALTAAISSAAIAAVISPNQVLTLQHAPVAVAGVAAGLFQLSQRVAAAVAVPAVTGAYLVSAPETPGRAHLTVFSHLALTCAGLLLIAALLAVIALRTERQAMGSVLGRGSSPAPRASVEKSSSSSASNSTQLSSPGPGSRSGSLSGDQGKPH